MNYILKISVLCLSAAIISCKGGPSDEKIQQDISAALTKEVTASVTDGVATLTGTCPDETCKTQNEASAKNVTGVKGVVNNITITAPPAPSPTVAITADDPLKDSVNALVASYKTVQATVDSGVVTLTGQIKRSQLTTLMQSLHELKPKKVENKLTIK